MAKIVGYVKEIEGEFIAKSKTGETRVLHKGDPVYETDLVYNPSRNTGQNIDIDLISTKDDLKFNGNGMAYLEGSTFDASIPAEDMTLSQADVNSNLRDVKTQSDFVDDILKEYGDIDINETAIGKEEVLPRGHEVDQFAKTDGAIADVNSDLRNVATHSYNLEHDFDPLNSNGDSGFSPTHFAQAGSLGPQTPPPPNPTLPTQPYNPPQPAPAPAPAPTPNHQPVIPEVFVNDTVIHEQNGVIVFTLRSSAPIGEDIIVHYTTRDASAINGDDYTYVSGTAVIRGGETHTTVEIPVNDDNATEPNENFNILISSVSDNARIADGEGIATIIDDRGVDNPNVDEDVTATLVIDDAGTVREADGNYLVYDVKLSNPVGNDIPVSFSTAGTATSSVDYDSQMQYSTDGGTSWSNITSTIDLPADGSSIKVRVAVKDDSLGESDETIILQANSSDPRLTDSSDTGAGIITDGIVYLKLDGDDTVMEQNGATLNHTITLVDQNGNPVNLSSGQTIDVTLSYSNDTTSTSDFTSKVTTFTITGNGSSSYIVSNIISDDTQEESDESYTLKISSITANNTSFENLSIDLTDNHAVGTIVDNDRSIQSITDAAVEEGGTLVHTVTLNKPGTSDAEYDFNITDNSTTNSDYDLNNIVFSNGVSYDPNTGKITIPANVTEFTVSLPSVPDNLKEGDETYTISITDGNPVTVAAIGTISDEALPTADDTVYAKITTDHATITEDGGDIVYTVSLVDKDGNPVTVPNGSSLDVDINWSGAAGIDDTTLSSLPISVTINGNTDHTDITIPVKDDYLNEGDEPLTATITTVTDTNSTYEHTAVATQANGYIPADSNMATTTIKDGSNENDHGTDSEDTVYAMITPNDTTVEGGYLTHTITLVDKDGTPVTVPNGKSVTVDLSYTDGAGLYNGDFRDSRITQVTINGGESSATIQNLTKDDFIQENDESYTLKIINITDSDNSFEHVAIANSANGYLSDSDSVTGTIQNGVTPDMPDNTGVDEDDFDLQNNVTSIQDTGSLHITSPNENNYTLTFEQGIIAKDDNGNTLALTSDGKTISYDYGTEGKIVANDSDGAKVFEIILDKDNGNYTYTQYKNLDHPTADVDDNITLSFNYDVNDTDAAGDTYSKTSSFNVIVNDSMPSADPQTVSTDEDTSTTIYISDESFKDGEITLNNGNGNQTVPSGSSIDIYDKQGNDIVGTLTNNGDGTLTFSPKPNYSGDTNGFSYNVSDGDGDNAGANVAISVKPVADMPIMPDDATLITAEDFVNTHEGTNTVDLNLSLPSLSNQTDQTDQNGTASGDAHERFGLLEFSFANSHDFGTAILKYDSDGNGTLDTDLATITKDSSFTIDISDVNEYHPANLGSGTYSLTQAQYESLAVVQAEDNANNIIMDIKTKMHEVDDNADVFNPDIVSNYSTQTVTVDILAATDAISLKYDDNQGIGTISSTDDGNSNTDDTANTFTFDTVDEDSSGTVIDLKSILTKVSGTEDDTSPDLDGSEHRSYEFSGLPEGSIITLDGVSTAAASDGTATINFPDNTNADPDFTLQIAPNYSGSIDATMTLKVTDTDNDSTVTPQTKEVTLYLKGDVNPVADDVTIQVKQTIGLEDAGRSAGNDANDTSASDIDHPENGIPIDVKVTSDDDRILTGASTDNAETYMVTIDKIPDGASLYIADTDGTYYLYDKNSGNLHNVNVTDNSDATYKVLISNYDNDKLPLFIPPHNSDENYTFDISAYSNDGNTQSVAQTLQVNVEVTGVADIPTNTDLHLYDRDGNSSQNGAYAEVVNENEYIDLKKVYQDFTHLNSYDKDGSEALSVVISDLPSDFGVSGKALSLGNGKYVVSKDDLDSVHINFPDGYAGEANFKLTYITTEREGDSKTHFTQDVKVLVTPVAEASLTSNTNVDEDMQTAVHFTFVSQDSSEALKAIYLKQDDIDSKDFTLKLAGNDLSVTENIGGDIYYKINAGDMNDLTVQYGSDLGNSSDTLINIKYVTTDTVSGLSDGNGDLINTSDYQDGTANFTLSPVTDGVSVDINGSGNISGTNITASDGTNGEEEVSINDTGDFTTTIDISALASDNGDKDTDGSENVTKLIISNVPDGIIVENATRVFGENEATWVISTNGIVMNADTKTYTLTFRVGTELYNGVGTAKDITITAVDKDGNAQEVKADTQIKFIDNIDSGNGGSTDTVSADLHIDHPEIVEDTTFYLGDFIKVDTDPNDGAGDNSHDDVVYSISITNLQGFSFVDPNSTISYNDSNGNTVYVISGDESSINSALQRTALIPDENLNSNNIGNGSLNADITLNAYMLGVHTHQVVATYNETSVTPVTDDLTPVTANDSIDEDSSGYGFDITFNSVDKPHYVISNVVLHTDDTTLGTLKLSDGTVVNFDGNGDASIDSSKLTGLTFIPAADISGQAVFTYKADVLENGASNTLTSVDGGTVTIDINPVVDGLDLSNLVANGDEHYIHNGVDSNTFIELTGIGISGDGDGSESVKSITIDNVPDGFLVYYGDSGSETMALNAGDNGSGSTFDLNGTQVGYNIWAIPVSGGAVPHIYITPPQNWSGEVTDISLNITNIDGSATATQTQTFDLDINPVANDITASATKTFGNEGEDIPLNLNANAEDLDGSESVILTLHGFGDDKATFKISGESVDSSHVSYDSNNDTYTITDINTKDINDVSVIHASVSNTTIDFTLQTVDSATINGVMQTDTSSSTVSGSFDINITESIPSSDDDVLLYKGNTLDALGGNDTLILNGETIDFSNIKNIETLDLNAGDNSVTNLSLSDVVDMTDSNNTLAINGDGADSVTLGGSGWSQGSSVTENGHTYDTYSNSSDPTVTLKIEDHITVS